METFSALLTLCAGTSPVTDEFHAQRPVTRSFDVFFDLRVNKRLSEQSWGWWFETPARSLWRHCNSVLTYQLWSNTGIVNALVPIQWKFWSLVAPEVVKRQPPEQWRNFRQNDGVLVIGRKLSLKPKWCHFDDSHWLHCKLSFWQFPVHPVTQISLIWKLLGLRIMVTFICLKITLPVQRQLPASYKKFVKITFPFQCYAAFQLLLPNCTDKYIRHLTKRNYIIMASHMHHGVSHHWKLDCLFNILSD